MRHSAEDKICPAKLMEKYIDIDWSQERKKADDRSTGEVEGRELKRHHAESSEKDGGQASLPPKRSVEDLEWWSAEECRGPLDGCISSRKLHIIALISITRGKCKVFH